MSAVFRHGNPVTIDYTPVANVAAGDIVILGNTTGLTNGIAHVDIPAGTKGGLGAGNGVYKCSLASNYAAWSKVYQDPTNTAAPLTTTSTNNSLFGYTLEAGTAANSNTVDVLHHPRA